MARLRRAPPRFAKPPATRQSGSRVGERCHARAGRADLQSPAHRNHRSLPPAHARAARRKGTAGAICSTSTNCPGSTYWNPCRFRPAKIDKLALERNARLLENVLDDFNVKGEITAVRSGPVVTMDELEPAPGIKASRVIGLSDDIARNMSAISARVSSIPGRTVMGIELPNAVRDMVSFHELAACDKFVNSKGMLPIILGKDIAGEPIVADPARPCRTCWLRAPPARASR